MRFFGFSANPFRNRPAARIFPLLIIPLAIAFLAASIKHNVLEYGIDHPDIGRRFSRVKSVSGVRTMVLSDQYPEGFLFFGPYLAVSGGRYEAAIHLRVLPRDAGGRISEIVRVSAVSKKGRMIHCQKDFQLADAPRVLRLKFTLSEAVADLEVRAFTASHRVGFEKMTLVDLSPDLLSSLRSLFDRRALLISLLIATIVFLLPRPLRALRPGWAAGLVFVLALSASLTLPEQRITGDEPHYLINARNLLANRTLDLAGAYSPGALAEIWPVPIERTEADLGRHVHRSQKTGKYYSHHGYLLSMILAVPFGLGGLAGVRMFLSLVFAALIVLFYRFCLRIDPLAREPALLASLLFMASPLLLHSIAVYPDMLVALVFLATLSCVHAGKKAGTTLFLVLLGLSLNFGPKFLLPILILALYALAFLHRCQDRKRFWISFLLFAGALATYFIAAVRLFGTPALNAFYSGGSRQFLDSGLPRAVGMAGGWIGFLVSAALLHVFDNRAGILPLLPYLAVVIAPFIAGPGHGGEKDGDRTFNLVLLALIATYMGTYAFSGSSGGTCPLIRPWIAVLPLVFILFFRVMARKGTSGAMFLMAIFSIYQVVAASLLGTVNQDLWAELGNNTFRQSGDPFLNLGSFFPALRDFQPFGADLIKIAFWVFFLFLVLNGGRLRGARGDQPWAKGR